jgi:hypothetical protein
MPADSAGPAVPERARWRVSPGLLWFKVAGAVILTLVAAYSALAGHDPLQVLVAGAAAVGLAAFALRDLLAPVRLEADADGVTLVAGFARRVRLSWSHIEAVRVDARSRYGIRSAHLEIDAGETLYIFGANDLGAAPEEVAPVLDALRSAAAR